MQSNWYSRIAGAVLLALLLGLGGQVVPLAAQQKDKDKAKEKAKEPVAGCTFELYKDSADEFRFRLKNGDVLLATSGKGYKTKEDCQKVIDTIRREAAKAKVEDMSLKTAPKKDKK